MLLLVFSVIVYSHVVGYIIFAFRNVLELICINVRNISLYTC